MTNKEDNIMCDSKEKLISRIEQLESSNKKLKAQVREYDKIKDYVTYLETILNLMPGNVYWKTIDGKYQFCNVNATKIVGFSSSEEVRGKRLHDFVPKKYADPIEKIDQEIMTTGISVSKEETAYDAYGNIAIYLTKKTALRDKNSKISGLLGVSFDITKQKNLEKKLTQAKKIAEAAEKAKTTLLRNMEHDIRTPISGILGLAGMLTKQEVEQDKLESLFYIYNCADKLLAYCNRILELAVIDNKSLNACNNNFDLFDVFNRVMIIEKPVAKSKDLSLISKFDSLAGIRVVGDDFRLSSILINLVSNAVKFTDEGYVEVAAHVEKFSDKNKVVLHFMITDTGCGIEKGKAQYVFKMQEDDIKLTSASGLGLKIVKKFMANVNGKICFSDVGKGTKITGLIPYRCVKT